MNFVTIQDENGDQYFNFLKSQIWEYTSFLGRNLIVDYDGVPWTRCALYINITRRSKGLILRLALPVMFMVLLVSLTYWADLDGRVDATVTLLLAISALYIVIFQYVPMIGKLTQFDKYDRYLQNLVQKVEYLFLLHFHFYLHSYFYPCY